MTHASHARRTAHTKRDPEAAARREFLKTVRTTAITAPAVALLLAASAKPTSAQPSYDGQGPPF